MNTSMLKRIEIDEMKKIELEILKSVADFCDANNLTYFLAYGTLIGAVRHKGFIPWDDDVDIWMPRKDYNKLIELFNKRMVDTPYVAIAPFDTEARHSILKIGDKRTIKNEPEYKNGGYIDIDVFPLDGVPENQDEYDVWYDKMKKLYNAFFYQRLVLKTVPNSQKIRIIAKKVLWGCYSSKMRFYKKSLKMHEKYQYDDCSYVGAVECLWNSRKNRFQKEWFNKSIKIDFEQYSFNAPEKYHEILFTLYGEYMNLPPENERVPLHKHETYWREV